MTPNPRLPESHVEHDVIYLEPQCPCNGDEGRMWCRDNVGPCDECGAPWVKFVRAKDEPCSPT